MVDLNTNKIVKVFTVANENNEIKTDFLSFGDALVYLKTNGNNDSYIFERYIVRLIPNKE